MAELGQSLIGRLEVEIDLEKLITGQSQTDIPNRVPEQPWLADGDTCFIKAGIGRLEITAPGVRLLLTNGRLVVHGQHLLVPQPCSPSGAGPESPASPTDLLDSERAGSETLAAELQFGSMLCDICSNWVLMGLKMECYEIQALVDTREDVLPHSRLAVQMHLSLQHVLAEHTKFFGTTRVRYEQLNRTDKQQALLFHLKHMPIRLAFDCMTVQIGPMLNLSIEGAAIQLQHEEWVFFRLEGHLHKISLRAGSAQHPLILHDSDCQDQQLIKFVVQLGLMLLAETMAGRWGI